MKQILIKKLGKFLLIMSAFLSTGVYAQPSKVLIERDSNGGFFITVNNERFNVKGAGLSDPSLIEPLANAGANSIRTWTSHNADTILKLAKKHNLMVALGFGMDKQLNGFDYNDEVAVAKQFERFKAVVDKYKNHPNLLCWVVANEPNLFFADDGLLADVNPKVYDAINDMINYVHKEDPNHPVTYTFAGIHKSHIDVALTRTPNVDFISLQVYGELMQLPERIKDAAITKPFMITEYGATGHWEMPATSWQREIEEPSGVKADNLIKRIKHGIVNDTSGQNIGDFVFYWGQKQERTPTWYGLFNKDGTATAAVDEMTHHWTGSYPKNKAPRAMAITINGKLAIDNIALNKKQNLATVTIEYDGNSPLRYEWTLLEEVINKSDGGAFEQEPKSVPIFKINGAKTESNQLAFSTPEQAGEYRLFVYVYDELGNVANANLPFIVKQQVEQMGEID